MCNLPSSSNSTLVPGRWAVLCPSCLTTCLYLAGSRVTAGLPSSQASHLACMRSHPKLLAASLAPRLLVSLAFPHPMRLSADPVCASTRRISSRWALWIESGLFRRLPSQNIPTSLSGCIVLPVRNADLRVFSVRMPKEAKHRWSHSSSFNPGPTNRKRSNAVRPDASSVAIQTVVATAAHSSAWLSCAYFCPWYHAAQF